MVVSTLDSALSWFYLLGNMSIQDSSNWDPVYFPLCPVGSLSTLTLSILESGYMRFCPCRSVPTIDSVNSGFCSRLVLSTWESVHLGIYLLRFSPLGNLATWHVAHVGLCPLLLLSPLDSAHVWFCFLGSLSNSVFVYFNSVHLGSLVTWHSAHAVLCPLLILSSMGLAHVWFCLLRSQSTWVVVYLESVLLGVGSHDILPT